MDGDADAARLRELHGAHVPAVLAYTLRRGARPDDAANC